MTAALLCCSKQNPHSENSVSVNFSCERFAHSLRPIYKVIKITGTRHLWQPHSCCSVVQLVANKTSTSNPHSENSSSVNISSERFCFIVSNQFMKISKLQGDPPPVTATLAAAAVSSTSHLENSFLVNPSDRLLSSTKCFWLLRNLSSQNKIAEWRHHGHNQYDQNDLVIISQSSFEME